MIHHFILTRFALNLWKKEKHGSNIDRRKWLEERLGLFEEFCLPSILAQKGSHGGDDSVKRTWVLLCEHGIDDDLVHEKMASYKSRCEDIHPVMIKEGNGWRFAEVFQQVVTDLLIKENTMNGDLCLTTYLDNDDCLASDYSERIYDIAVNPAEYNADVHKGENFFIAFDYGFQLFTEIGVKTRVRYANNHFMTLCETVRCSSQEPASVNSYMPIRTCFGYGSHFLLEKNGLAKVIHIENRELPMWTEVVHGCNVDNDVKMTFDTKIIEGSRLKFYARALKQIWRRGVCKLKNKI